MRKTFQYKLYRSKRTKHLNEMLRTAKDIWNYCIKMHRAYYEIYHQSLSCNKLKKHLTKVKKRNPHWRCLGSQAIQDIAEKIDKAYKRLFKKQGKRPRFKSIQRYRSFTLKQIGAGYDLLEGNKLRIGKHVFKFVKHRELEGKVKTLTIKRDALGDWFLFFSCEIENEPIKRVMQDKTSGFDFGFKTFLTFDDGSKIQSPLFFKQSLKQIRKLNRSLSRKERGSKARRRARTALAMAHRKVANQRRDWFFKLARKLALENDALYCEDLDYQSMIERWGRKASDLAFSSFLLILDHMCNKLGSSLAKIDRWFPSTKTCHVCGAVNESLSLEEREWKCICGVHHDRDVNAAINIHTQGHLCAASPEQFSGLLC